MVDKNAQGIEYLFKKNKIEGIHGRGWLLGANDVEVEGADGTATYTADNVLIATGSVPRELPVAATDGERILNSDHILKLARVPGVAGGARRGRGGHASSPRSSPRSAPR